MKTIPLHVEHQWAEGAASDQIKWHRDVGGVKDEKLLEAYRAGFMAGWRQAISALLLHKFIARAK